MIYTGQFADINNKIYKVTITTNSGEIYARSVLEAKLPISLVLPFVRSNDFKVQVDSFFSTNKIVFPLKENPIESLQIVVSVLPSKITKL